MKKFFSLKLVIILLIALISSQMVEAKVDACVEYDANRTLEGFKNVILTWKNPFIKNELWPEYIMLVNQGLKKAGKPALPLSQKDAIQEIMDHTVDYQFSWYDPANFENGANVNGSLEYRDQPGQESPWAVYEKDGVSVMFAKIKCCNPQRPKVAKEQKVLKTQPAPTQEPCPTNITNNYNYYGGNKEGGYGSGSNYSNNQSWSRIPPSWFKGSRSYYGYNQNYINYNGYNSYDYPNYYLGNRMPATWFNGNRSYRSQYRPEPQHYERPQQQHRQQPQQHQQKPQPKRGPVGAPGYSANGGPSGSGGYSANTGGSPSGAGGGFSANNGSNLKSASRSQVSRPSSSNRSSGGAPRGQSRSNSSRGGNRGR